MMTQAIALLTTVIIPGKMCHVLYSAPNAVSAPTTAAPIFTQQAAIAP